MRHKTLKLVRNPNYKCFKMESILRVHVMRFFVHKKTGRLYRIHFGCCVWRSIAELREHYNGRSVNEYYKLEYIHQRRCGKDPTSSDYWWRLPAWKQEACVMANRLERKVIKYRRWIAGRRA